jgi:biotin carboxyl carrier protein
MFASAEVNAGDVLHRRGMKVENEIAAHRDGVVNGLSVAPGQPVTAGRSSASSSRTEVVTR